MPCGTALDEGMLDCGPLDGPPSLSSHGVLAVAPAPAGDGIDGAGLIPPTGNLGDGGSVTEGGDGFGNVGSTGSGSGTPPDPDGPGGAAGMVYPFLVPVVVSYLNLALQAELGSSGTFPKVFADAAIPGVRFPYIIIHDTDEHYSRQSRNTFHASGHIYCVIKSNGKAQAHAIGIAIIRVLLAAEDSIAFDEGTLLEITPLSGNSTPIVEMTPGPNAPIATERTIGFHYVVRYDWSS